MISMVGVGTGLAERPVSLGLDPSSNTLSQFRSWATRCGAMRCRLSATRQRRQGPACRRCSANSNPRPAKMLTSSRP